MGNKQSALSDTTTLPQSVADAHIEAAIESVRLEDDVARLRAAQIEGHSSNPSRSLRDETSSSSHNFGQPASNWQDRWCIKATIHTDCRIQQRASLACIEVNYQNKDQVCAAYFEAYKKCRKEEHERKLDANAKAW
jgi:hypothetical protein